jgi:hypothetical protein
VAVAGADARDSSTTEAVITMILFTRRTSSEPNPAAATRSTGANRVFDDGGKAWDSCTARVSVR